ncbi:MAG: GNAT family N-acetyltransferase [Chloroflexota bacterium]|mgnify:CR=1 FL=1|nr:GNAT family N-acetyltransferase [Chloroflexota bacterium]
MMIRRAVPDDAPELARLIGAIWHDDTPNADALARVIRERDGGTLLAHVDARLIGFVDAFLTLRADGALRWEVDLLGVCPDARGKGIAADLIASACTFGAAQGAQIARAIVRGDNLAAQKTFGRAGFTTDGTVYRLCVASPSDSAVDVTTHDDSYLLPVATLTYRGVWIEGTPTPRGLAAARSICARHGWETAGILLTEDRAIPEGYAEIGVYQVWTKSF